MRFPLSLLLAAAVAISGATAVLAQQDRSGPLRIEITEGVIEPLPFAAPEFVAEDRAGHVDQCAGCLPGLEGDQRAGADRGRGGQRRRRHRDGEVPTL